jgi:hypothetical protein
VAEETGSENTTKIGLRADMTIDDEPVAVEGILGSDFFLQLSRPATLGTPISFAYWLEEKYQVPNLEIMLPKETYDTPAKFKEAYKAFKSTNVQADKDKFKNTITAHIKGKVPPQLEELVTTAFLAELTITDLLIDIKAEDTANNVKASKKMMFGLSVGFPAPLALIPNVDVNRVSILVMNAPKNDFTFPPRAPLPLSKPLPVEPVKATGYIAFSGQPAANSTITLGEQTWKFVSGTKGKGLVLTIGGSIDSTLAQAAADLNKATAGSTALCSYRANLDEGRLEITYRKAGFTGNGFAIAASANSNGVPSGQTLTGGVADTELHQASGSFVFKGVPTDGGKITLNGTAWTFSTADPTEGEKKSKIGADEAATVKNLAEALNASDDAEIGKCAYVPNGKALAITFNAAGPTGNAFTIAADAASNATPSGATLAGG